VDAIPSILDQLTTTTLLLIGVTGSMVLVLVVGGISYMRRNFSRPAPVAALAKKTKSTRVPVAGTGVSQQAQTEKTDENIESGEELREWENQLADKLRELENRFTAFADKLGRIGATEAVGADIVDVLARGGMSREYLEDRNSIKNAPSIPANRIAGQLRLSEEQMKLVKRIASRTQTQSAVGS
jgi:hypothetical protein